MFKLRQLKYSILALALGLSACGGTATPAPVEEAAPVEEMVEEAMPAPVVEPEIVEEQATEPEIKEEVAEVEVVEPEPVEVSVVENEAETTEMQEGVSTATETDLETTDEAQEAADVPTPSEESEMAEEVMVEPQGPSSEQSALLAQMDVLGQPPELNNEVWLNSDPLKLADLQGKVVLVEFWTFG
jgi:hypothetical protein